ncbi:hypothetical protein A6R68_05583, partial [Neotoma lepida]
VGLSLLHVGEDTSSLHNVLGTSITPFDIDRTSLLEDEVDDKFPILSLDHTMELAVDRVILEHVDHVVEVSEEVIDGNNIHFATVDGSCGKDIPELNGKLTGITFTIPILNMSIMDLTCHLEKAAKYNNIKKVVKQAPEDPLKGILGYTEDQ